MIFPWVLFHVLLDGYLARLLIIPTMAPFIFGLWLAFGSCWNILSASLSLSLSLPFFPHFLLSFFLSLSFPFHRLPSRRTARGLGGRGVTRFRVAQPYPSDSSRFRPMGRWGNSSDGSDFPDEYPIIIHRSSLLSFPRDSLGILESDVTSGCDTNRFELAFDSICMAERAPFNPLRSLIKTNHF